MEHKIPVEVVDIMRLINNQNRQCFLIGGAPRDILMNNEPKDYDLCTDLPLEQITELIPHFHLMKQTELRNTGVTKVGTNTIEISEFKGKTLEEDILRRDFTINGVAMDSEGNLIDPYNHKKDIETKTLSLIDKTGISISNNPMLILRALRLASQYGLTIDENTKNQIKANGVCLTRVIGQKAYGEFAKLIITNDFSEYLEEYFRVFVMLIPELINVTDFGKTYKLLKLSPNNLILKLAALFSLNKNNVQDFTQFANRMCIDKKTIKIVSLLLSYKGKDIDVSKTGINRTIHEFNIQYVDLLFAYKQMIMVLENQETKSIDKAKNKYQKTLDEIISSRISNLQINLDIITAMGFGKEEAELILSDVKGRIITNSLQNNENSIEAYILNKHKKS